MHRIGIQHALVAAAAAIGLMSFMPIHDASAQGTQGYSTNNGGSTTTEGMGTRGGSDVTGSGPGGPRDPARLNNANPNNNPNLATGRRDNPNNANNPNKSDPTNPTQNPPDRRR